MQKRSLYGLDQSRIELETSRMRNERSPAELLAHPNEHSTNVAIIVFHVEARFWQSTYLKQIWNICECETWLNLIKLKIFIILLAYILISCNYPVDKH